MSDQSELKSSTSTDALKTADNKQENTTPPIGDNKSPIDLFNEAVHAMVKADKLSGGKELAAVIAMLACANSDDSRIKIVPARFIHNTDVRAKGGKLLKEGNLHANWLKAHCDDYKEADRMSRKVNVNDVYTAFADPKQAAVADDKETAVKVKAKLKQMVRRAAPIVYFLHKIGARDIVLAKAGTSLTYTFAANGDVKTVSHTRARLQNAAKKAVEQDKVKPTKTPADPAAGSGGTANAGHDTGAADTIANLPKTMHTAITNSMKPEEAKAYASSEDMGIVLMNVLRWRFNAGKPQQISIADLVAWMNSNTSLFEGFTLIHEDGSTTKIVKPAEIVSKEDAAKSGIVDTTTPTDGKTTDKPKEDDKPTVDAGKPGRKPATRALASAIAKKSASK